MENTHAYKGTCSWPAFSLFFQVRPAGAPGASPRTDPQNPDQSQEGAPASERAQSEAEVEQEAPWNGDTGVSPYRPLVNALDTYQPPSSPMRGEEGTSNTAGKGSRKRTLKSETPRGRTLLSTWGLHIEAVRSIAEAVQTRVHKSQPRPMARLMDLITLDHLRLALCLVKEESSSADSAVAREEMWEAPEPWLTSLLQELQDKTYRPRPIRRQMIPKGDGNFRPLGLPALRDKVVQMALLLILDPLLDPHFLDNSVGFRLGRQPQQAIHRVRRALESFPTSWVLDLDLKSYFDTIPWIPLLEMLKQYVEDPDLLHLIQQILTTPVRTMDGKLDYPTEGSPQGGILSPLLANLYLHHVLDTWLATSVREQIQGCLEFARFADDIVIVGSNVEAAPLVHQMVLDRMKVYGLTVNQEKTKLVTMTRPDRMKEQETQSFPFLGFQFLWQSHHGRGWRLANVISENSIKKSLIRLQGWLDRHAIDPTAEDRVDDPAEALGRRMAGFYGYYLHPHPDDVWALHKHNTQALQLVLDTWGPQGMSLETERAVRFVMDPANRKVVFETHRYRPKTEDSQPRRAEAFGKQ